MPRRPRLHIPHAFYHVTLRGNHKEPLFGNTADRLQLNDLFADASERFGVRLHAFCWMTNHLHALVQVAEQPLRPFVMSVAGRYSRYRHKALDTSGHLFERRHGARLIDVDSYFLAVLRYIHLNPVKAGMVSNPSAYPWSSHRAYLGSQAIEWVTVDFGLSLFSADLRGARAAYARFVRDGLTGVDDAIEEDAWSGDPRILGSDEFVTGLRSPVSDGRRWHSLEELAADTCASHGITTDLLRSRAASHDLTPIRIELLERAVDCGIATLTGVARYLGRDASTLSKQWKTKRSKDPITGT